MSKKVVKTTKGKELFCFDSTFIDDFHRMKRFAQIITPKDIGIIIGECGLNRDSIVVEGGSGSGALACFLAKIVKKVHSYDINEEHQEIAKENAKILKVNVDFKLKDLSKVEERDVDVAILDVPQPWDVLKNVRKAVKQGGYIVAYCPTITQVSEFVNAIDEDLIHLKTLELIERNWKVKGKAVRPVSAAIGHTAFLTFVRKLK